jgi:hypothetical protein
MMVVVVERSLAIVVEQCGLAFVVVSIVAIVVAIVANGFASMIASSSTMANVGIVAERSSIVAIAVALA